MILQILQYSGIIITLGLLGDCLTQSGDSYTAGEADLGRSDEDNDVSDHVIRAETRDRNISNGIQNPSNDSEEVLLITCT